MQRPNEGNGVSRPKMVLLIGGNLEGFLEVLSWLYKRGCRCHFATSLDDACRLISSTEFDLVLSQYQLLDRTAFSLCDRLAGSHATLFLSKQVESGCVWLPLLECGKGCIGTPMLRPRDFAEVLENAWAPHA
jgi:PleD family two-component response regulator